MPPLWLSFSISVNIMLLLTYIVDDALFIFCLFGGQEEYDDFHKDCLSKTTIFIVLHLLLSPVSLIFQTVSIVGLLKTRSVFIVPWLIYFGFSEAQNKIMVIFTDRTTKACIVWNVLNLFVFSTIWIIFFLAFRYVVNLEKENANMVRD